jgi:hypothetical protein
MVDSKENQNDFLSKKRNKLDNDNNELIEKIFYTKSSSNPKYILFIKNH